jgi:hypothetical protein
VTIASMLTVTGIGRSGGYGLTGFSAMRLRARSMVMDVV